MQPGPPRRPFSPSNPSAHAPPGSSGQALLRIKGEKILHTLEMTETVRSFLSSEGVAALLTYLRSIAASLTLTDVHGQEDGAPTEWVLDCTRNTVTSVVFLKSYCAQSGPMTAGLKFALPPKSLQADVPEEHRQLIIHEGQVWTFGDLAFLDVNRFFYGIDFRLEPDARARMHSKLLETNPAAFWSRPL